MLLSYCIFSRRFRVVSVLFSAHLFLSVGTFKRDLQRATAVCVRFPGLILRSFPPFYKYVFSNFLFNSQRDAPSKDILNSCAKDRVSDNVHTQKPSYGFEIVSSCLALLTKEQKSRGAGKKAGLISSKSPSRNRGTARDYAAAALKKERSLRLSKICSSIDVATKFKIPELIVGLVAHFHRAKRRATMLGRLPLAHNEFFLTYHR